MAVSAKMTSSTIVAQRVLCDFFAWPSRIGINSPSLASDAAAPGRPGAFGPRHRVVRPKQRPAGNQRGTKPTMVVSLNPISVWLCTPRLLESALCRRRIGNRLAYRMRRIDNGDPAMAAFFQSVFRDGLFA